MDACTYACCMQVDMCLDKCFDMCFDICLDKCIAACMHTYIFMHKSCSNEITIILLYHDENMILSILETNNNIIEVKSAMLPILGVSSEQRQE